MDGNRRYIARLFGVIALLASMSLVSSPGARAGAMAVTIAQTPGIQLSAPFQIVANRNVGWPDLAGNLVVYTDCTDGPCNIWGVDLTKKEPFQISQSDSNEYMTSTDGKTVVWADMRNAEDGGVYDADANVDIYGARLSDLKEFPVTEAPKGQIYPSVGGDTIVWSDTRTAKSADDTASSDIYMYSLAAGKERPLASARFGQYHAVTDGKYVVWADYRTGTDWNIYGYDLKARKEFVICKAKYSQSYPDISGNIVVWTDWRNGKNAEPDIYGYDLTTKKEFPVSTAKDAQWWPSISGNLVVWEDNRNEPDKENGTNVDIYGYDLKTKREFPVSVAPGIQYNPKVSNGTVIWEDNPEGHWNSTEWNILGATITISGTAPTPAATPGRRTPTPKPATPTRTSVPATATPTPEPVPAIDWGILTTYFAVSNPRIMHDVHGEDMAGNPLIFDALGVDLTSKLAFYTADVAFGAYYFDDQGVAVNILPGTPGPVMIRLNPDYTQWKQGDRSLGYFALPEDHERIARVEVRKLFLFAMPDALQVPGLFRSR